MERQATKQETIRNRWLLAAGLVSWLVGIVAPAIAFDVELAISSDVGTQYRAYFQIFTTVLFLLGWRMTGRLNMAVIAALAVASVVLFFTYSFLKDSWSCAYLGGGRYIMGATLTQSAHAVLASRELLDALCVEQMAPFGGDGFRMWERTNLIVRYMGLFGLYSMAWLSLAVLVVAALRRNALGTGEVKA